MKAYLLIFFFLAFGIQSFSQDFAPIGATWHYRYEVNNPRGNGHHLYKSTKDTVYKQQLCKKIERTTFFSRTDSAFQSPLFVYQKNDTVFYYNDSVLRFLPLYFYNVKVGDTISFRNPYDYYFPIATDTTSQERVDSITNFIVGTDTLRDYWTTHIRGYFYLSGGYTEQIGSYQLMLPTPSGIGIPEVDGGISCYEDNSIFYKFIVGNCENFPTGISTLNKLDVSIYPNPTSDFITIKTAENSNISYEIIDMMGKKLNIGNFQLSTTIDITNLTNGIYYFQLKTDKEIFKTEKFVIQH